MTEARYEDLPRASRRRLLRRAVLRPALTVTCILGLYFAAPSADRFTAGTALMLGGGLLLLAGIIAWQTRAISRSPYPRLRAIETLALAVPAFLVLFAAAYFLMGDSDPSAFSERMSRTDALYFTITVFATVGFGDIVPRSDPARILTMVQMLGNLVVLGLVVQIVLDAVKRGLRRRADGAAEE
ncbi:two pore domain potassium channel family protein [Streptomyces sp. A7024]|uniref:Two pore domain potassium channel family protein n=1 Tax=Streptomyces coryli TaxID=1128680 RepID=A0A6G4TS75_9ACTN|nr:potassium channel family protein [Streptomyces coryli]NGN62632.1 two pore domain potassium channel family protein [Streptomyces coryli]